MCERGSYPHSSQRAGPNPSESTKCEFQPAELTSKPRSTPRYLRHMIILLTGATGMLGHAVLLECLENADVTQVRVLTRRPLSLKHAKLSTHFANDFTELAGVKDAFVGVDACLHCMGVSAVGLSEDDYTKLTYVVTATLIKELLERSPESAFVYVSGVGTDTSQVGKVMWARVKGRTEQLVLDAGFRDAYAFRPGAILPEKGVRSSTRWYQALYTLMRPLYPLFRLSKITLGSSDFGKAMLLAVKNGYPKKRVEPADMHTLLGR